MAIPELGKIEVDPTQQLRNDLTSVAGVVRELADRQQAIVQALTQFQMDMNNLGLLSKHLQDQIDTINRRHKNMAKRGGQSLDDTEPIDTESVS